MDVPLTLVCWGIKYVEYTIFEPCYVLIQSAHTWLILRVASTAVNMHSVGFGDSSVLARSVEYMYSLFMYMYMHSIFAGFLLFYTKFYKRVGD